MENQEECPWDLDYEIKEDQEFLSNPAPEIEDFQGEYLEEDFEEDFEEEDNENMD